MEDVGLNQGQVFLSQNVLITPKKGDTYKSSRLSALDLQRGLIMCLMAFSHCRDYVSSVPNKNLSWNSPLIEQNISSLDFLQKSLISLVAAGGFYMMMGIGIFLLWQSRIKDGVNPKTIRNYLVCRGFVLVTVQFTVLALFETIAEGQFYLYVGVLFSLGICMMMAAWVMYGVELLKTKSWFGFSKIEYWLPLSLGLIIILFSHGVIWSNHHYNISPDVLQIALLLGGEYHTPMFFIDINFTPFPWFPSVALGLIIGKIVTTKKEKAWAPLCALAFIFLTIWFVIRTANIQGLFFFGDYKTISPNSAPLTWQSYMSISKFPPSLTYFLWSWSINLLGIVWWFKLEQIQPKLFTSFKALKIFGQNALFFFIGHWFIYYGLSIALPYHLTTLTGIITVWLIGLIILLPLCKRWYQFKSQKNKNSLWRMF
ncbi:hypothetical protein [Legionella parisiensis]|uniref:Heparan-alpha-glucosaminide N-acetyltransferase catalytic domain-containing protein n=1 Tax=Legionella parisiensis TaxID=45071 RepID=A0A1E5JKN6_9GAMM|nr:hypothetical protein [Legionella parisiensis]KTD43032.1 hypothetical protein Lpar_1009 [Legionella parisiensis]OEH45105.1 hypothetical protein lpari_03875 [Legionella parisiensis]STX77893.1 Predicted membrane protein [Legionella parisiensis]